MDQVRRNKIPAFLLTVLVAPSAFAQVPAELPPRDPLPMFQFAQTIAEELSALCTKRFPELKASIDKAYQDWPLRSISISVQVNGKEYRNPGLEFLVSTMRRDFLKEEEAKSRKGCDEFPAFLDKMARDAPPSLLLR